MKQIVALVVVLFCFFKYEVNSLRLPGPRVYVVTPSPKTPQINGGRTVPFYYRNWIKRMDTPGNASSTTTTTTTQKTKTPDLIFAEFESDNNNMKSIRKLLQKESIDTTTTTTTTTSSRPIYVPDEENSEHEQNYGLSVATTTEKPKKTDMTDYFALYNNMYNTGPLLSPVYVTPSSSSSPMTSTTLQTPINNVENIWHIIDSEKNNQNPELWEEESVITEPPATNTENEAPDDDFTTKDSSSEGIGAIDDNFAIPGFSTNPGNGAENESRAIRTEPNFRFPYVNLKPFQMKSSKKPLLNSFSGSNSKKGQNMFTSLDNFHDFKNPVRGEAQDVVPMRQPIDRYNPAQPYLPQQPYGPKPKQSSPGNSPPAPPPPPPSTPVRAVANLVPPPPPPAPRLTANDFPTPSTYESFPPYAPAAPAPSPLAPSPPVSIYQPPTDSGPDSSDDSAPDSPSDDSVKPPMDLGYRYKPPSPPVSQFFPTISPPSKPFSGYSYNKPTMSEDSPPPTMDMGSKPDFQGYHYSQPEPSAPPQDHLPVSYGHHDAPPSSYQPDYPELVFDKPHGGSGDMKDGHDMKDSLGMKPPPAPPADDMTPDMGPHAGPGDDSGFPHDFPGDFKFHHDFDDHDYHYHHHTTTTTTETPRVNRYSYYYLGKKLYYLPLYFSVYFIVYVGALIIKAVLRHKIVYPNSWRPNDQTASFFSKRSIESHLENDNLHEITGRVTRAIASAAEKYMKEKNTVH